MTFSLDIKTADDIRQDKSAVQRARRDSRLADSDWTMLPDSPTDKDAWAAYRQALRDVTKQTGFPNTVTWPTPPSG